MSKKVKFELNSDGVKELLKGPEMQSIIRECAGAVLDSAGDHYEMEIKEGANRCWGTVRPVDAHGYYSNLKHNTLLKALGGVRYG